MPELKCKLLIAPCSYKTAKYAVINWHYSRAMPASKLVKFGVWEDEEFIGAVIFGRGACAKLFYKYHLKNTEGCELVRVALKDHKTPVSRIVAIAMKLLKKTNPGLKLVVSFADTGQGHLGRIYQAGNWIYAGSTGKQPYYVVNGKTLHPRTMSERVRKKRMKRSDASVVQTAEKHRYLYPLDKKTRQAIAKYCQPYPKCPVGETVSCSAVQPEVGGSNPTTGLKCA